MKTQFGRVPFFLIYPETPIFCRVTKIELESSKSKPYYPLINVVHKRYVKLSTFRLSISSATLSPLTEASGADVAINSRQQNNLGCTPFCYVDDYQKLIIR